ncbi:hypothetical protein OROMI_007465 [Orobanche minor]
MFYLIKNCKTAKEMWDKIRDTCEGSEKIKKSKLELAMQKFHSISMNENESIEQYELRFTAILNELTSLDKTLEDVEVNKRIMSILSSKWEMKALIMKDMRKDENLSTNELISELKAYEYEKLKQKLKLGPTSWKRKRKTNL